MNKSLTNKNSLEELVAIMSSSPEKYAQLQVFLHRKREVNYTSDKEFLMVSPTTFGKILVQDLTVDDPFIIVQFLDCTSREVGLVRININEEKPCVLFVNWKDLRKMILQERRKTQDIDELLELEY